jgi:hypothetical protein
MAHILSISLIVSVMLLVISIWTLYSFQQLRNPANTGFTDSYINTGNGTGWTLVCISVLLIFYFMYLLGKDRKKNS